MSKNQKRKELKERRAARKEKKASEALETALKSGSKIRVDRAKIVTRSDFPTIPEFYSDKKFSCKDCGSKEIWSAKSQKWWYEEAGGEIETRASRCRACRRAERERKEEARRLHLDGLAKKK